MNTALIWLTYVLCHLRNMGVAFVLFYLLLRRRYSDRIWSHRIGFVYLGTMLALIYSQLFLLHKVDDWREDFTQWSNEKCSRFNFSWGYLAQLDVPVFYINPAGAVDRRLNMERALNIRGLEGVRVSAVAASHLAGSSFELDGERVRVVGLQETLASAVLVSHVLAARKLWLSGVPWGIVAEDDANFDLECLWEDNELGELIKELPVQWQALHLYTGLYFSEPTLKFRSAKLKGQRALRFGDLGGKNNYYWGAVAYALSRRGAERLLNLFAPSAFQSEQDLVLDFRNYKPMVSEETLRHLPFLFHSTRLLVAHGPFLATHQSFQSLIHVSHSDFHQMTNDIMLRFFYDDRNPVTFATAFAFLKFLPGYSWANALAIATFFVCGHRILHIITRLKPSSERQFIVLGLASIALLSLILQTFFLEPL